MTRFGRYLNEHVGFAAAWYYALGFIGGFAVASLVIR